MNKSDYLELQNCRFVEYDGAIIKCPWDPEDVPFDRKKVGELLDKQLTEEIDLKNVIVLFPGSVFSRCRINVGCGSVNADHVVNWIYVRNILKSAGVTFRNGESLNCEKYSQTSFTMIVVHDGIAYPSIYVANPLRTEICYSRSNYTDDIKINREDIKMLDLDNKKIFFSGFFLENINSKSEVLEVSLNKSTGIYWTLRNPRGFYDRKGFRGLGVGKRLAKQLGYKELKVVSTTKRYNNVYKVYNLNEE